MNMLCIKQTVFEYMDTIRMQKRRDTYEAIGNWGKQSNQLFITQPNNFT